MWDHSSTPIAEDWDRQCLHWEDEANGPLCTCLRNILKAWILFVLRDKALGFETWISMLPIWGAGNLILSCQMMDNLYQFAKQEQESLKYQLVDVFGCLDPTNTKISCLLLERLLPADNLWSSKLKCWMLEDYMHDAWIYVFRIHTLYAKHILTC